MTTFAEGIATALPEMQAHAESLMVDTCTVTRGGGSGEWVVDPETGYEVPDAGTTVYAGPCKVNTYQAFETSSDVGAATVTTQRYMVHVPVSAGPFEVGDVVVVSPARPVGSGTVLAPETPLDEGTVLTGQRTSRTFRVAGLHEKTWQTAQRLLVDEGVA